MITTSLGEPRYLEVLGGTLAVGNRTFEIGTELLIVGRATECHVVLADPQVSAAHFELEATPLGVHIRDRSSKNGTFIRSSTSGTGQRCVENYLLEPCEIICGRTRLQFTPASVTTRIEVESEDPTAPLVGRAPAMLPVFARIRKVAPTNLTVLILGETGTGKELAARAIHLASQRARRPYVIIDCSTLSQSLAESALFGHKKGAFTGALEDRVSPFVEANGGTVFLDELGELAPAVQPMLLRALQERAVKPLGSNTYVPFDARIVAATRRDLDVNMSHETPSDGVAFRSDLYFRIAQSRLELPPLRNRVDDIEVLFEAFARDLGYTDALARTSPAALARLAQYDWPGNVRELKNVIEVTLALAGNGVIDFAEHLPAKRVPVPKAQTLDVIVRRYFENLHAACDGNVSEIAREAGVERSTVRRHLRSFGLSERSKGRG